MKRILAFALLVCMCIGLVSVLGSCDEGVIHTHTASDTLSYDSDFHWYPCLSEACNVKLLKAEHTFITDNEKEVCEECGYEKDVAPDVPEHEHVFKTEYTYSENFHWYACETEGCQEMNERVEHAYLAPEITQEPDAIIRAYTCADCGYSYTDRTVISSVVDGEAAWSQAFENLELVNFSLRIFMENNGQTNINKCEVTEDSAYYCIGDYFEYYTQRLDDGTCVTYVHANDSENSATPFIKLNDTSDEYLKRAQIQTVLKVSFADHYDKFVYDENTGEYIYDDEIEATAYFADGEPYPKSLICFNNVVKVADGKIINIACDYRFEEDNTNYSFTYYNIGITEIVIPDSVIDNAVDQGDMDIDMPGHGEPDAGDAPNVDKNPGSVDTPIVDMEPI